MYAKCILFFCFILRFSYYEKKKKRSLDQQLVYQMHICYFTNYKFKTQLHYFIYHKLCNFSRIIYKTDIMCTFF